MAGRLEDKVALITGGASGQGRAADMMFASEGAKVSRARAEARDEMPCVSIWPLSSSTV